MRGVNRADYTTNCCFLNTPLSTLVMVKGFTEILHFLGGFLKDHLSGCLKAAPAALYLVACPRPLRRLHEQDGQPEY